MIYVKGLKPWKKQNKLGHAGRDLSESASCISGKIDPVRVKPNIHQSAEFRAPTVADIQHCGNKGVTGCVCVLVVSQSSLFHTWLMCQSSADKQSDDSLETHHRPHRKEPQLLILEIPISCSPSQPAEVKKQLLHLNNSPKLMAMWDVSDFNGI